MALDDNPGPPIGRKDASRWLNLIAMLARKLPNRLRDRLIALPYSARVEIFFVSVFLAAVLTAIVPAITQDQAFHGFADTRMFFGIPNFGDVLSNAAYLGVGLFGLAFVFGAAGRQRFASAIERLPYVAYFAGVALVAFGSAYYHWAPTDTTLAWDRLAMTMIFASLFSIFVTDRVNVRFGTTVVTLLAVVLGILSMVIWSQTGDLRLYRFVEFYAIAGVLLICLLFDGRLTRFRYAALAGFWFAAATLCEAYDQEIWVAFNGVLSGHTIKHLLAAVATFQILLILGNPTADVLHQRLKAAGPSRSVGESEPRPRAPD